MFPQRTPFVLLWPLRTRRRQLALVSLASVTWLSMAFSGTHRETFLPGSTSSGHHLFEESCHSCHVAFEGVPDRRCRSCHLAELRHDSHPTATFDDPRWAAEVALLDARRCASCHHGHERDRHGVTAPRDFCITCHADIRNERVDHRAFAPGSCAATGCHNYHDNSTLNASFLRRHAAEPDSFEVPRRALALRGRRSRSADTPVVPADLPAPDELVQAWKASAHAYGKVNCDTCHRDANGRMVRRPTDETCARCHEFELQTAGTGAHGVRRAVGLPLLRPADGRRPMKADATRSLGCRTCHDSHRVDIARAAVAACLGCHDDAHSRAYSTSAHARLGAASTARGSRAVTCATCHLPRVEIDGRVAVNHSNSFTSRPRDRMARLVCIDCHGLAFSLAALADDALVNDNFRRRPLQPLQTFTMLGPGHPAAATGATR